ncbi:putative cyclin-dependent kinase F-2 [Oryza brachyantha]|uniref:putative cyclin-dependent kinase F-2 n=1 Tax=Oryza brachyantha TaxID=4533 RepID=UPI001ADB2CB9|nr:putative cyclin-dependent kinase F-2 [Oryza brachyantha]
MERYECLGKIGEGAAGVVHRARDRATGETVAVKRLRGGVGCGGEEEWLREARCLEACRGHPHLVELRAAHLERGTGYVVMEYVDGPSLARVVRREGRGPPSFAEGEVRRLMRQLLDGVAAMHAAGVVHRDLKPDNVVVGPRGDLKICDFGMSRVVAPADAPPYTSPVVTLWYRAPELILGSREYDARVDTWALGCIMAELLAGAPLFPGRSEMDQLNRVFDTVGMQDMRSWPGFARLPRAESALCHRARPPSRLREMFPALSAAGFDVLSGLLACRPDRRLAAADALRCPWFTDADADAVPAACGGARFTTCVSGVADAIVV